jgi:hypothetical protein
MMQIFIKMGLFSKIVKKQEGLEKNPYKFKKPARTPYYKKLFKFPRK